MLSYSLIKLFHFHNLSVGDFFTDKPQNREKLLIKPQNREKLLIKPQIY